MYFYDINNQKRIWIHLHGLATNVYGQKIEFLRKYFSENKLYSFFAMDMDYEKHTTTTTLNTLKILITGFSREFSEITLCGSSHGAYVALNYLRFMPLGNIKRLILLAPSYNTLYLMIKTFGEENLREWLEGKKEITVKEDDREVTFMREWAKDIVNHDYEIIENNRVKFPKNPPVEIIVMHGKRDEIVPIEYSEMFTKAVKVEKFLKVDDDHGLNESLKEYIRELIS